jgi:hydrogenase maturation protein HypF
MIRNNSSGVEIELDGERAEIERFVKDIPLKAPKHALIREMKTEFGMPCAGYIGFTITESEREPERNTLISPDLCICDDCLRELFTPGDRRWHYPFINCTNCGPRFTIVRDVPYDRKNTSMAKFPMCPDCEKEYRDILDRRYHAQPDACPVCGPRVLFYNGQGELCAEREEAFRRVQELLAAGGIAAIKGLGGIHLACKADDPQCAVTLRKRKQRDEKPFAVMCRDAESVRKYCELTAEEEALLTSAQRPIVLLRKKKEAAERFRHLSENGMLGVMLPYTPLHYLLFEHTDDMLVMTSANLSETPIISGNEEALKRLKGIADGYLLHDRDIVTKCDDSLCAVVDGEISFYRRSRGYVPYPITCRGFAHSVLACGAEQKATACLTKGENAFLCQHIGDLKNAETYQHYLKQIRHFEHMFDIEPEAVVCDLHPDYLSTEAAEMFSNERALPLIRVQHHHAHMAACMADNGLTGDVIGLIWDGTGLGEDGTTWGGECLAGGYEDFRRIGSIRRIPLIGGDQAVTEIERVAFALLREAGCEKRNIPQAKQYEKLLANRTACPLSSGMGRLFDGVSAILGIRKVAGYEGQGAVLLEAAADENEEGLLPYELKEENGLVLFDWRETVCALAEAMKDGAKTGNLAARFMNTLIDMAVHQCKATEEKTQLRRVVLSGGCFQNLYLLRRLPKKLEEAGFEVYRHRQTACNDEGLALGQAAIAEAGWRKYVLGSAVKTD